MRDECLSFQPVKIVVLGSSTAAGTGPSSRDSAWVWRYRRYLQQINSQSEVINLAQGGYTTYRLMPHGHVPQAGRPAVDSAKNITQALSLNPDAIIVNLPSNDRSYPIADQLANFDSLYRTSLRAGVPMWICTTQPIASSGAYQREVRDSIVARYGTYALDFWTGIVVPATNLVDTVYAADAVHLNDLGHRILVQSVIDKNIPLGIFQADTVPDLRILDVILPENGVCLNGSITGITICGNFGRGIIPSWNHQYNDITDPGVSIINIDNGSDSLRTCQVDTIFWSYNPNSARTFTGPYELEVRIVDVEPPAGTFETTQTFSRLYRTKPTVTPVLNARCGPGPAIFEVQTDADTVEWYDQRSGGNLLGSGNPTITFPITQTTTLYARGLHLKPDFSDILTAENTATVNWNGFQFLLIADRDLRIDSLGMYLADAGRQEVTAYTRNGSFVGFGEDPAAWTLWGTDSLDFVNNTTLTTAVFPSKMLRKGDSLAVYLMMSDSGKRLRYLRGADTTYAVDQALRLYSGQGMNHNFGGGNFFPRRWTGEVYFSGGGDIENSCNILREPVTVEVDTAPPVADFSFMATGRDLTFQADSTGRDYFWEFGDGFNATGPLVTHKFFRSATWPVSLVVSNTCGSDTIVKQIAVVGVSIDTDLPRLQCYPNPSQDGVFRLTGLSEKLEAYKVHDIYGREISATLKPQGQGTYALQVYAQAGTYILHIANYQPTRIVVE